MGEDLCSYNVITKTDNKTLTIDCRRCNIGNSTIFDKNCRSNILRILQTEHGVDAIILNHALVQVFRAEELDTIKELARFIDGISVYGDLKLPSEKF
ncbi:MAG: hypothetical protein KAW47_06070, partial [Thermoplasmatales archaeon]|nr:hypothetical protein [Thermoplasmatales archaeon]